MAFDVRYGPHVWFKWIKFSVVANVLTRIQYIEMNATSTWMNMEHFDLLVTKRNVCFEQTSEFQETI